MFNSFAKWWELFWFNPRTIEELAIKCATPQNISTWMRHHITYISDQKQFNKKEYWQTAEEVFKNRKGDCEDFSVLAKEVLVRNGFVCFILCTYGKNSTTESLSGHAVCVTKWRGVLWHISNWGCIKTPAISAKEVRKYVYKYSQSTFYRYVDSTGNTVIPVEEVEIALKEA